MKHSNQVNKNVFILTIVLISILIISLFSTFNKTPNITQTKATEPILISCIKPNVDTKTYKVKFNFYKNPDESKTLGLYKYDYFKKNYFIIKIFKKNIKKSVEAYSYTIPKNSLVSFFILQPDSPVFESPSDPAKFLKTIRNNVQSCITIDTQTD
jgi:hypothetical protein